MHFYFINLMRSIPYFSLFSFPFSVCYQCVQKELSCPKGQLYSYLIGLLPNAILTSAYGSRLVVLECCLVWYGQLLATLSATCSQYLTAIGSSHSLTETVLVDSLATRWLVSSFHCHSCICFLLFLFRLTLLLRGAKVQRFFVIANNSAKIFCFFATITLFYSSNRLSSPRSTLP